MFTVDALKGITFDVPHGSVTGIIGANGAGKSTLLRAIAGIIPPDEGRIEIRGKITTMLSVGIGFNASLSGRENVILSGLATGLTPAQVEERFDLITEFADLGEFIDLPIKTYSSGMRGRLAFSVAVHMDPNILLIDEALSAGDAAFKEKATEKMLDLCRRAGTILLVSHGLGVIRNLADRVVWLHKGTMMAAGDPDEVVDQYIEFVKVKKKAASTVEDV